MNLQCSLAWTILRHLVLFLDQDGMGEDPRNRLGEDVWCDFKHFSPTDEKIVNHLRQVFLVRSRIGALALRGGLHSFGIWVLLEYLAEPG